jgi:hypothetical protein
MQTAIKDAYNTAATEDTSARRAPWSDHEVDMLVKEFLEQRRADPFTESLELLRQSMRKVLPEHRAKNLTQWATLQPIRAKISDKWLDEMTKQNPDPVVVHVETQAPPDYIDILHRCDLPSLIAMVVKKLQDSAGGLTALVSALAPQATNGKHVGAPHQQAISLLAAASAKPRKTRVLIFGPSAGQFHELETRMEADKIPVELLYLDKDKPTPKTPLQTDYVVATLVNPSMHNLFRQQIPAGKYHLLEGAGLTSFVNKLRDIGALLPPRA